jgi:hypothetical protein
MYQLLKDNATSNLPLKKSHQHPYSTWDVVHYMPSVPEASICDLQYSLENPGLQTEAEEIERIEAAQKKVNEQIQKCKERMVAAEAELNAIKPELAAWEKQR